MYQLRGVTRIFDTREQALSFLLHSPGYVKRRQKYLATYWPGLLADVKGRTAPKGRAGITVAAEQAELRRRSAKLRGEDTSSILDKTGSLAEAAGKATGKWAVDQVKQTAGAVLYGGRGTSKTVNVPAAVQHTARVAEKLVPGPTTVRKTGEMTLGTQLTKVLSGERPSDWKWLAGDLAISGVPWLRGAGAAGAAIRAAKTGADAAEAARLAYEAGGPISKGVNAVVASRRSKKAIQTLFSNADDVTWARAEWAANKQAKLKKNKTLPSAIRSPKALAGLMAELRYRMYEGLPFAHSWYRESGAAIRAHSGDNLEAADRLAALTAIYSPQQAVVPNIGLALRAAEEYRLTGKITTGSSTQIRNATTVMEGGDWLAHYADTPDMALKIRSFYGNLLKHIDTGLMQSRGFTGREVTADGWIAAAFKHGTNTDDAANFTPDGYRFMERTVQRLADEAGIEPEEAQAAIWASIKANNDRYLKALYRDPNSAHEALLRAGVHFQQGLESPTHTARFAFEAASSEVPEYWTWPTHVQRAFTEENAGHVLDAVHAEGLTARLTDYGISTYINEAGRVETNPAVALELAVGTRPTGARLAVTKEQRGFYDGLAAAIGTALKQESAGWLRPVVAKAQKESTFWVVDGSFTPEQLNAMAGELDKAGAYVTQTSRGIMAVAYDPGAILRGTKRGMRTRQRLEQVVTRLAAAEGGTVRGAGAHTGGYVGRADYADTLAASGRPDLLGRVSDRIAGRAAETRARFIADPEGAAAGAAGRGASGGLSERLGDALSPKMGISAFPDAEVPLRPPQRVRTLKAGQLEQQLPTARNRLTRAAVEDVADAVSTAMMGEGRVARGSRWLFRNAAADARVAKAAGMYQVRLSERAQGAMARFERVLPKEGSEEDVAHFWWAQLDPQFRNRQGLQMVRARQARNLEDLTSGKVSQELDAQLADVKEQLAALRPPKDPLLDSYKQYRLEDDAPDAMDFDEWSDYVEQYKPDVWAKHEEFQANKELVAAEAPNAGNVHELLSELGSIRVKISDVPLQIEDLSLALARLDKVIKDPPKLKPEIIHAVEEYSARRRKILEEAGLLDPEQADARTGLVSNWLGQEPSGREAFLGHRLGKVKGSRPSGLPAGGTGRVSTPQGLSQNRLVLANTGRLRESTRVAVEDWQASQVYASAVRARDDLGKMGKRFTGTLAPDEVLINPKGRPVPAAWKRDKISELADQGYDEEEIRRAAKEITDTYFADGQASADALIQAAAEDGVHWSELRVVKRRNAERYYKQFRSPHTGGAGRAYDMAVDLAVTSIVFARIGYIPKNVAANLIMAVPHQGVYMFANIPRAAASLIDNELRGLLEAEVGFSGASRGLEKTPAAVAKGLTHHIAAGVGNVADTPLRVSAFLHEAAAEGIIPRLNPNLRPEDKAALLDLLTNPAKETLLNDIRSRAVEAMADFSRLNPTQRKWSRRFLIVPGWLWAGSRYPFHFAVTHPGRTAAIGYVAAGQPGREGGPLNNRPVTDYITDGPSWLQGVAVGDKVLRTGSISPVSTPWELGKAILQKDEQTVGDYANPFAVGLWNIANRQADSPRGTYKTGFLDSVEKAGWRVAPGADFVRDMISPSESKYYPQDTSRWGRLAREAGVVPIKVNADAAKPDSERTPSQRAYRTVFQERNEVLSEAKRLVGVTKLPQPLKDAYNQRARVEALRSRVARANGGRQDPRYKRAVLVAEARYANKLGLLPDEKLAEIVERAPSASAESLERVLDQVREDAWGDSYLKEIREARADLRDRGAVFTHGR